MKVYNYKDYIVKNYLKNKLGIFVVEEYGYKAWYWLPKQETIEEFISCWRRVSNVEKYRPFPYEKLGGKWFPIDFSKSLFQHYDTMEDFAKKYALHYLHLHTNDDTVFIPFAEAPVYHPGHKEFIG